MSWILMGFQSFNMLHSTWYGICYNLWGLAHLISVQNLHLKKNLGRTLMSIVKVELLYKTLQWLPVIKNPNPFHTTIWHIQWAGSLGKNFLVTCISRALLWNAVFVSSYSRTNTAITGNSLARLFSECLGKLLLLLHCKPSLEYKNTELPWTCQNN